MLVNVGFGNLVNTERVLAVVRPDAAPVKRMIAKAKSDSLIIDATQGRKTKSVLVLDEGHLMLSAVQSETILRRTQANIAVAAEPEGQYE